MSASHDMAAMRRCARCARAPHRGEWLPWVTLLDSGVEVGEVCPGCLTRPEAQRAAAAFLAGREPAVEAEA